MAATDGTKVNLNQCWLFITEDQWHSYHRRFTGNCLDIHQSLNCGWKLHKENCGHITQGSVNQIMGFGQNYNVYCCTNPIMDRSHIPNALFYNRMIWCVCCIEHGCMHKRKNLVVMINDVTCALINLLDNTIRCQWYFDKWVLVVEKIDRWIGYLMAGFWITGEAVRGVPVWIPGNPREKWQTVSNIGLSI